MEEGIVSVTPDKEKAKSIIRMVDKTLEMVREIDTARFPSNVVKEYYEAIRELASIILLLDGYATIGEGAHKRLIDYLAENYKQFGGSDIALFDDLRVKRNKIAYDGFFVSEDYVHQKLKHIPGIIVKLRNLIAEKLK